jgi:hypothetical protein
MPVTPFPTGISSFGVPVIGPGAQGVPLIDSGGTYYFVSSVRGDNGNVGSFDSPFATLAFATNTTTGNTALKAGDVIVVLPAHAETIVAAGGITLATAGVRVVGIGDHDARPTFTFGTLAAASILISGANCTISNVIGKTTLATTLANPIDITGNGATVDITWEDATGYEAIHVIRAVTVSNLTLKLRHMGLVAGSACVSPIVLTGCSDSDINIDFYGLCSTSVVQFVTTACSGIRVYGQAYVQGIANHSRLVVDTATGSKWWARVMDGSATAPAVVAGGSVSSGTFA